MLTKLGHHMCEHCAAHFGSAMELHEHYHKHHDVHSIGIGHILHGR